MAETVRTIYRRHLLLSPVDGCSCPSAGGASLRQGHLLLWSRAQTCFRGRSVLAGMRQALHIVRGIKVCFMLTLSLSSLALRSNRFMRGKLDPLEITPPCEYGRIHPKEAGSLQTEVSPVSLCQITVGKPFAFSNDLFKPHNSDISIYAWKHRSNPAVILAAMKAGTSTSKNVLIAFQSGDDAGGGRASPKCQLFSLKTFGCSKNVTTFYCRKNPSKHKYTLRKALILSRKSIFALNPSKVQFEPWGVSICIKMLKNAEFP